MGQWFAHTYIDYCLFNSLCSLFSDWPNWLFLELNFIFFCCIFHCYRLWMSCLLFLVIFHLVIDQFISMERLKVCEKENVPQWKYEKWKCGKKCGVEMWDRRMWQRSQGWKMQKKSAGVKNAGKENVRKEIKISSYVMCCISCSALSLLLQHPPVD